MCKEKRKKLGWAIVLVGIVAALAIILIPPKDDSDNVVTFKVECESKDIYQIYYTIYIDGEYFSKGGFADLDGNVITKENDMIMSFPKGYFEDKDISKISFTFSPYGKDDNEEIATTDKLYINAEYGKTYNIIFYGDKENGFKAKLKD